MLLHYFSDVWLYFTYQKHISSSKNFVQNHFKFLSQIFINSIWLFISISKKQNVVCNQDNQQNIFKNFKKNIIHKKQSKALRFYLQIAHLKIDNYNKNKSFGNSQRKANMTMLLSEFEINDINPHDEFIDIGNDPVSFEETQYSSNTQIKQEDSYERFNLNTGNFASNSQEDHHVFQKFVEDNDEDNEELKTKPSSKTIDYYQSHKTKMILKDSKERIHLKGKRRKKGSKNRLQSKCPGYWTKNFLPFAKNPHFTFIDSRKGKRFLNQYPQLVQIRKKTGMKMDDFTKLYRIEELREDWEKFFKSGRIYRELMISRTEGQYRLVYLKFLQKFKEAFTTSRFIGISRKVQEEPSKYQFP